MAFRSKIMIPGFLLFVILLLPAAGAISETGNVTEASLSNASGNSLGENAFFTLLSENVEIYNENFDEIPALFKKLVGSEEIALKIELDDGEMFYATALMNEGIVEDFYSYETENDPNSTGEPTITVESDEETVRTILGSEDPLKEAVKSMNEGNLDVECKSFLKKTVLWSIKQLYS